MDAFWIILTGILVASVCSLVGSFLLLRNMAMVGDAISHAVLPGIVISFLITGSRSSFPILIGASIVGLLTTMLIELLVQKGNMRSEAAIGVSYTALFSLGVILIALFAQNADLDQDCVLYGDLTYIAFDMPDTGTFLDHAPRAVWQLGSLFLFILVFVIIGYRGLLITSFDSMYAQTRGINQTFWHYILMFLTSLATVFSFDSVGAILVVAFLVGLPASAYLLTTELKKLLIGSIFIGIVAVVTGYYLGSALNSTLSSAMSVMVGFIFLICLIIYRLKKMKTA
jgi:manganese/zinc/iron transport system permease protein